MRRSCYLLAGLVGLALVAACLAVAVLLRGTLPRRDVPDRPLDSTAGQLAFISDRDGARELYLMDADGGRVTRLTAAHADIWAPAWSPGGRYLAYVQGRVEEADVYLLDVEAALQGPEPAAPLRLTEEPGFDGYPVWSPSGEWLVFGSQARAPAGTYLVDVADFLLAPAWSEPKLLAPWVSYPAAWSPDGSHLAAENVWDLIILETDDLATRVQAERVGETALNAAQNPAWSPDGRYLVWDRDGDLYRVDASGADLTRLTDTQADEFGAAWSPDGQQIAYLLRDPGNSDLGQPYIMNADGTDQRWLRAIPTDMLTWSPDSTRLAFYSNRGRGLNPNGEIWVMNRDGTGLTLLTDHPAFDGWPSWRPDLSPSPAPTPAARASLESALALALRGVSRNEEWTPYVREFGGVPMALVPAGCFRMGRTQGELEAAMEQCQVADPGCQQPDGFENQAPAGQVCFDQPFWMGVTEVSVAQFRAFGELGECANDREGDQRPCLGMNSYAAARFCEQYGLRLPNEAEWEYSARGPDGLLFPW